MATIDYRRVLNTISDVVQNRPAPLREFDQIYMKVGDMVIQADFIARAFNGLNVVFIGDGDAISLSIMHLKQKEVFTSAPAHILLLDFDERIVNAVNHFARDNDLTDKIEAVLYNVCDPLPIKYRCANDAFYTNPPWGASNGGQSVTAFVQRGIEAVKPMGVGAIVIADDAKLDWTNQVLFQTQKKLTESGFIISEMIPCLHTYHLDDAPDLASCCIVARDIKGFSTVRKSKVLATNMLANFYGRKNPLKVHYVKDISGLNSGKASDKSYELIPMEKKQ